MTTKRFTFPKAEHLCLQKEIEALFRAGTFSHSAYPLRIVCKKVDHEHGPAVKVLLSVAKRKLRHAVDRNRAKRQLREAYRLQKELLLSTLPQEEGWHIGFIWLADKPMDSELVHKKVKALLLYTAEKAATLRSATEETESL